MPISNRRYDAVGVVVPEETNISQISLTKGTFPFVKFVEG